MGRHKKKDVHPEESMEQLLCRTVELYEEPYDDRDEREDYLPSMRSVADEMHTTVLRARKLLITADFYSTKTSRMVQALFKQGLSMKDIMEKTDLGRASVYSYLPYQGLAFNLDQTTVNADRLKLFRRRKKVVAELLEHLNELNEEEYLWKAVIAFEHYSFYTTMGQKYSYTIKRGIDGLCTEEIMIKQKEKTITRSIIILAFRKALEIQKKEGGVSGPKCIDCFGASYLYPLFLRWGLITQGSE